MNFKQLKLKLVEATVPSSSTDDREERIRKALLYATKTDGGDSQLGLDDAGFTGNMPRRGTAQIYRQKKEGPSGLLGGIAAGLATAYTKDVERTGYKPIAAKLEPPKRTYDPSKSIRNLEKIKRELAGNIRGVAQKRADYNQQHAENQKILDEKKRKGEITAQEHSKMQQELNDSRKKAHSEYDAELDAHREQWSAASQISKQRQAYYGYDQRGNATDFLPSGAKERKLAKISNYEFRYGASGGS